MMTERTSGQDFGNKTAGPLDDKSVILRKLTFKTGTVGTVGTAICMTYSCTINYMCGGAEGMIMTMFEYYSTNIRFYSVPKLEFSNTHTLRCSNVCVGFLDEMYYALFE